MSRVNNSVLWEHFERTDSVNKKAKCLICGSLISYKTTTGNLKTHLRSRHIDTYRLVATVQASAGRNGAPAAPPAPPPPPPSGEDIYRSPPPADQATASGSGVMHQVSGTRQTKLDTFIPKKITKDQKAKIDHDLMGLFTKGFQPFNLVEEESFQKFARWIPGYELPSRKHISSVLIPRLYEQKRDEVKKILSDTAIEKICLTVDLWTSKANESYIAITGHFINNNFKMQSVLLSCEHFSDRHTSANIQDFLSNTAREWNIADKINFVISDNAANVQKALQDLGWKHFGCYGHTLNLIVQNALITVQDTLDKVKTIVRFFKKSPLATEKLLKYQKNDNEAAIPVKLKQDMPTRWNSTLHMITRFVELQAAVKSTAAVIGKDLPILTVEEWALLEQLIIVLKPFDDVTSAMSAEKYVTGGSVIVITRCLIKTCEKLLADHLTPLSSENLVSPAATVAMNLRDGLISRLGNVEKSGTFAVCTFLDPRYKVAGFADKQEAGKAKKRVQDKVHHLIAQKCPDPHQATNELACEPVASTSKGVSPWSVLNEIMTSERPQRRPGNALSKAIQEVDLYLEDDMLAVHMPDGRWNCPLEWWQNHHQKYPHLSKLFRQYGNIVATSVPCERIFSKAGQLITDRRTRLDHKKVAQVMFLNGNT
ncbi:hypothetical protein ABMA27_014751 [Loxostege sticticalis]|uniref:BED-type domain-containing protein n=1 Tax=Loxostege sticticalis TaxID=481309 RepID=A0ABR3IA29_LOXSC